MIDISNIYKPEEKLGTILWLNSFNGETKHILYKLDHELKEKLISVSKDGLRFYRTTYSDIIKLCNIEKCFENKDKRYFYDLLHAWFNENNITCELDGFDGNKILIKW